MLKGQSVDACGPTVRLQLRRTHRSRIRSAVSTSQNSHDLAAAKRRQLKAGVGPLLSRLPRWACAASIPPCTDSSGIDQSSLTNARRHNGHAQAFKLPQTLTTSHRHDGLSDHIRRRHSSGTACRPPQNKRPRERDHLQAEGGPTGCRLAAPSLIDRNDAWMISEFQKRTDLGAAQRRQLQRRVRRLPISCFW